MKKRMIAALLICAMGVSSLVGCGKATTTEETKTEETTQETKEEAKDGDVFEDTEINVFIAASLSSVMEEVAKEYNKTQPNVKITFNADSSGTLLTQIEEGAACDIFFSAAQKQMDKLEEDGLIVDGTRANVLNNQVVVITRKDSGTKVTGLEDIANATSVALADGSVPVGKYTRQAMVKAGMLAEVEDVSKITTQEIMDQLGVEISECSNVSKVRDAVKEASCEVGTTYYSDIYGFEDQLEVLQTVSYDLTGNVIYPVCQVQNDEADQLEQDAAASFREFILSDQVKEILKAYYFDTDV